MTTTFPFEAETDETELKTVGKSSIRIDGLDKISGAAQFVDDMDFGPGLLHAAIVESPHAYARIISIDTSEAEKAKGVVRVVTGADFPYKFGMYMEDRYIFAQDHVRFAGEQVAGIIARTHRQAVQAAKLIKVDYEVLTPLLDPVAAVADGADLIHPDLDNYTHVPWFFPQENSNIAHLRKIRKGDTEKAFAESDYILEDTYHVPPLRPLRHRAPHHRQQARPGRPPYGMDRLAVAAHPAAPVCRSSQATGIQPQRRPGHHPLRRWRVWRQSRRFHGDHGGCNGHAG